jgi:hypothetical protein
VSDRRLSPSARLEAIRGFGEAPRQREKERHGVLGDGHGVEPGHIGHPHTFVRGRVKVHVVDPDSELLDEAEVPRPDRRPGQQRPERDDHVDGRPPIDQARFELTLPDDLDHEAAGKAGGPELQHVGPGVVLGEPLLSDEHPERPLVGVMSRSNHGSGGKLRLLACARRRRPLGRSVHADIGSDDDDLRRGPRSRPTFPAPIELSSRPRVPTHIGPIGSFRADGKAAP